MLLVFFTVAVFVATLIGGAFALRYADRLHLILGFSAGAVLGVALFDLLPEAFELEIGIRDPALVAGFVGFGFFAYLLLDRFLRLSSERSAPEADARTGARSIGSLGAFALVADSFLDGIAIGAAFQASLAVGVVVALALLAHDAADGINTVNLVLRAGGGVSRARRWLLADALAPVLGIGATLLVRIPQAALGLVLALFAGAFLYLSASDLIPESHHRHPRALTTLTTLLGAGLMYAVVRLAG